MTPRRITVFELAPAADELWELPRHSQRGYLYHRGGAVGLPDVERGAKLRPDVRAAYASGKATNVARVFDAFLRPEADTLLAGRAREELSARLTTFLPGAPAPYKSPDIPGGLLSQFTPGGAYLACLQSRDFTAVDLSLAALPATDGIQTDRRCANIVGPGPVHDELVNFSPYLLWSPACVDAVTTWIDREKPADLVALAGSLPLVDGRSDPCIYGDIVAAIKARSPHTLVSLDVGGAPISSCLERPEASPDFFCINVDEYLTTRPEFWETYRGTVIIHDKRGCWVIRGEAPTERDLQDRGPDVAAPEDVSVVQTICAGDAAHGGLLLGLMLFGTDPEGLQRSAALSQACGLTVVESHDSIRGLTAEKVEANLARL